MFTYYFLNLIAKNLFSVNNSELPNEYQIGLSSTLPTKTGVNITEPDKSTGYKRIKIINDNGYFAADNIIEDNDYTLQNTHLIKGVDEANISLDSSIYHLSKFALTGKTDVSEDLNFHHMSNIKLEIISEGVKPQILELGTKIKLKHLGNSYDEFICYKNNAEIRYNTKEIEINGLDYKLHATAVDNVNGEVFCKIFREYDDKYLTTNGSFIINKNNETQIKDNLLMIKITFKELQDAGYTDDLVTTPQLELNNIIARYNKLYPIKVLYELDEPEIDYNLGKLYYQFNLMNLTTGNNVVRVTSDISNVQFQIEYKKLRPYIYNSVPLVFNEAVTPWEGIQCIVLFDQNDNLLYYSKLSEVVNIPARCILSMPVGTFKIECVNMPESNGDYYTKDEVDNKAYISKAEARQYINDAIKPTQDILNQVIRGE